MLDVVSVKVAKESDLDAISSGITEIELTGRAALGVFKSFSWSGNVAVFCGPGNNGGDGYALSVLLNAANTSVTIFEFLKKDVSSNSASFYYRNKCVQEKINIFDISENYDLSSFSIIVDCLFGIGFRGECKSFFATAIKRINETRDNGAKVVSVDINSGLNGDTGLGSIAIKSDLTVSIGWYKAGHFLNCAKDYIGDLTCIDIGVNLNTLSFKLIEAKDLKPIFPKRKNFTNKGDYGKSLIIAGCANFVGAAKLANLSQASLLSGVGISALVIPKSIQNAVTPYLLESILYLSDDCDGHMVYNPFFLDSISKNATSIAIGPGLGTSQEIFKIVSHLIENYSGILTIDADGINALSQKPEILLNAKCKVILTPHIKEFHRLTGESIDTILNSPIDSVLAFSRKYNTTILLKGPSTIISDGIEVYITNRGTPAMSTGGSGDVLTGVISGLSALKTCSTIMGAAAASYITGAAAELACSASNEYSLLPHDVISMIPTVISNIINGA
ncbi:MAG: NAD(P)H-hydrate dehydratase [Christensenellaceae bacterium]|jgi:NAD(P)H-hydrate epimerase|nr:NAD(P)H-hydrate dehydratase [Christensenellaceae bacterium]